MQQLTRDVPAQFRQTVLPFLAESVLILSVSYTHLTLPTKRIV